MTETEDESSFDMNEIQLYAGRARAYGVVTFMLFISFIASLFLAQGSLIPLALGVGGFISLVLMIYYRGKLVEAMPDNPMEMVDEMMDEDPFENPDFEN